MSYVMTFFFYSFSQKYPPVKFLSEKDRKRILVSRLLLTHAHTHTHASHCGCRFCCLWWVLSYISIQTLYFIFNEYVHVTEFPVSTSNCPLSLCWHGNWLHRATSLTWSNVPWRETQRFFSVSLDYWGGWVCGLPLDWQTDDGRPWGDCGGQLLHRKEEERGALDRPWKLWAH